MTLEETKMCCEHISPPPKNLHYADLTEAQRAFVDAVRRSLTSTYMILDGVPRWVGPSGDLTEAPTEPIIVEMVN